MRFACGRRGDSRSHRCVLTRAGPRDVRPPHRRNRRRTRVRCHTRGSDGRYPLPSVRASPSAHSGRCSGLRSRVGGALPFMCIQVYSRPGTAATPGRPIRCLTRHPSSQVRATPRCPESVQRGMAALRVAAGRATMLRLPGPHRRRRSLSLSQNDPRPTSGTSTFPMPGISRSAITRTVCTGGGCTTTPAPSCRTDTVSPWRASRAHVRRRGPCCCSWWRRPIGRCAISTMRRRCGRRSTGTSSAACWADCRGGAPVEPGAGPTPPTPPGRPRATVSVSLSAPHIGIVRNGT